MIHNVRMLCVRCWAQDNPETIGVGAVFWIVLVAAGLGAAAVNVLLAVIPAGMILYKISREERTLCRTCGGNEMIPLDSRRAQHIRGEKVEW